MGLRKGEKQNDGQNYILKITIKVELNEVGYEFLDWTQLGQCKFQWPFFFWITVMNLRISLKQAIFFDQLNNYKLFKEGRVHYVVRLATCFFL